MKAQHQEEADYVGQRRTSLEATRLSCSPRVFRCFIILEEGLLMCRLFTGLALQLVPVVSIQVSVEVPSIQQIFPFTLLPWKAPGRGGSLWNHGKSPELFFSTRS